MSVLTNMTSLEFSTRSLHEYHTLGDWSDHFLAIFTLSAKIGSISCLQNLNVGNTFLKSSVEKDEVRDETRLKGGRQRKTHEGL